MIASAGLSCSQLSYAVGQRALLTSLSFELPAGQALGILGPNGAGKSTLLRLLSGYLHPASGEIRLEQVRLTALSAVQRARLVALVNPREELPPFALGVRDYLRLGRAPWQDWLGSWRSADTLALETAIRQTGITGLQDAALTSLSSGEWQRVQLARALVQTPRLLLLDEATAHLDVAAQLEVLQLLRRLLDEGLTLICVLHDLNLAAQFMDRLLLLHQGHLLAAGDPDRVLEPGLLSQAYGVSLQRQRHAETGKWLVFPRYNELKSPNSPQNHSL